MGLNELWLHNNRLESLPESIGCLTHLHKLLLDSNNLTTLPSSLGMLTSLARLSLTNNMLRALPAELGLLSTTLETLTFQVLNLRGTETETDRPRERVSESEWTNE